MRLYTIGDRYIEGGAIGDILYTYVDLSQCGNLASEKKHELMSACVDAFRTAGIEVIDSRMRKLSYDSETLTCIACGYTEDGVRRGY